MDLSISIVSWNTCSLLDACISSIQEASPGIEYEIIVADNASTDDSVKMLKEKYPDVNLIENTGNLGFARANNQVYARSTGRYFMLLNPDTVCMPGSLTELVRFMDANQSVGIVGPLVLNPDRSLQYSWARFPTLLSESMGKLERVIIPQNVQPVTSEETRLLGPFQTDWVGGCALVTRREAVECVGLMDESLFMYCEETDWCLRFSNSGWKIYVNPLSEIIHLGGQSSNQVSDKCLAHLFNSKVAYFRKHHGLIPAMLLSVSLSIRSCLRKIKHTKQQLIMN
ncbi:MAG: glycosyltransferase family 2 protein [Armatimonadota bacterium]